MKWYLFTDDKGKKMDMQQCETDVVAASHREILQEYCGRGFKIISWEMMGLQDHEPIEE